MSMKNFKDTIGNRTRDLLAGSTVPQPTAPPAACPILHICNCCYAVYIASVGAGFCCECTLYLRMKENRPLTSDKREFILQQLFFSSENLSKLLQMKSYLTATLPCI
jgi:hypothetical protein